MIKAIKPVNRSITIAILLMFIFFQGGCFWKKAKYDPEGRQSAVTLLKESLALMDKAAKKESYEKNNRDIYRLMSDVEAAYEHARTFSKNDAVIGIWNTLRDPNGNRLGKFMEDWKKYDRLDPEIITAYKTWVEEDFKLIIQIEEGKKK